MRGARRTTGQSGFTMIEVIASAVLFAITIVVALHSSLVAGRATASLVSSSELDLLVHRVGDRLTRELVQARAESLAPSPDAPYGGSTLAYERARPDGTGGIGWSTTRRLEFVQAAGDPLDGIDNDRNGLVDEGEIWLVTDVGLPSEERSLIVRHVASFLEGEQENVLDDNGNGLVDERGLSLELREGVLYVRVSLQTVNPDGRVVTRTGETAVRMRN